MGYSRRHFLKTSAAFGAGFVGLHTLMGCEGARTVTTGYGELVADPAGILDLPMGFSYKVISQAGERMSDGFLVPGLHDGMAAFEGSNGHTLLLRNHEVNVDSDPGLGPFGPDLALLSNLDPSLVYDAGVAGRPALGGVTTVVYDTGAQALVSHHLSLVGSLRNCAGGPTPWGSWVTCEETFESAGEVCAENHGYCFEVHASAAPKIDPPVPLKGLGRFFHEAIAVDPVTGYVYLTEDREDGLIYRFIPDSAGQLAGGGRLQALVVSDAASMDTSNWETLTVAVNEPVAVSWIDLEDIDPVEDNLRYRGFEAGAARFARGEGMWYADGEIYFACTSGGPARFGQIWKYTPETSTLELFVEAQQDGLINNADNLTVAPWGDLVVCEDSGGVDHLIGVTPDGVMYRLARNALSNSEFAGAVFSPDGSTLFVNLQQDGMTVAITGPWV